MLWRGYADPLDHTIQQGVSHLNTLLENENICSRKERITQRTKLNLDPGAYNADWRVVEEPSELEKKVADINRDMGGL